VPTPISAGWLELGLRISDDSSRRTIFVADAHRDDEKRFVVRADEKLTAFLELERVIRPGRSAERTAERVKSFQPIFGTAE
jgi:hypothetical protein